MAEVTNEKQRQKKSTLPMSSVEIKEAGESGRSGFDPLHFLRICMISSSRVSMMVNVLWPLVPAAIVLHFAYPEKHQAIFATTYLAMMPSANLLGFSGQQFARKLPLVWGILAETALGSVVEIILFVVLIAKSRGNDLVPVIQYAILGSIFANILLCLGGAFIAGGLFRREQTFHHVISESASGLLLVAGFALLIPSAFYTALYASTQSAGSEYPIEDLRRDTRTISRATSIVLIITFFVFLLYNAKTHDSVYAEILEKDEQRDADRHKDLAKPKLTFLEAVLAITLSLALVALFAVFLVIEIDPIVESGVPDAFLGLILLPLVEKAAEHLTAIDEAYDNQINFALFHCLVPSIQTALFNAPLVVIIAWGLGKDLTLNFEIFFIATLILAILCVGNFLRDGRSNYLEGVLCVSVYVLIATASWYYPNASETTTNQIAPE